MTEISGSQFDLSTCIGFLGYGTGWMQQKWNWCECLNYHCLQVQWAVLLIDTQGESITECNKTNRVSVQAEQWPNRMHGHRSA